MKPVSFLLPILCILFVSPASLLGQPGSEDVRFQSGNIVVRHQADAPDRSAYYQFLRDAINFGECLDDAKYRRLPITYYHPQGPMGLAFQKLNWFPGPINTYYADARLPASLVALAPGPIGTLIPFPAEQLVALWSEPPVGVIGMEVGTPAAYARLLQPFHFYEAAKEVIELSDRQDKDRFFHFIPDARTRGAAVQIFSGPPRQQLHQHGPRNFYHLLILEACSGEDGEKIALKMLTKEGIAECMEHLVDDGILCVHTSHRFVNLPPVLAAIGAELKLHVRRGHDQAPGNPPWRVGKLDLAETRHFTSEWVLLARHQRALDAVCKTPANYEDLLKNRPFVETDNYWTEPRPSKQVWTDKGPNLLHGLLHGHPFARRYAAITRPIADFAIDVLRDVGAGATAEPFIREWSYLPPSVDQWLVQQQLRNNPQVEKLWR